ncbi:hypothetical protein [Paracoccus salsus]|uniref:hypothetical protein n=1 Tax=Paracoccus salsus TaxID=2911061 RepID=UPI001F43E25E|nr:hypothetical protein [Paracoccus salsus]MCF3973680.1 hypothetical protein [Paracoccus salsus]
MKPVLRLALILCLTLTGVGLGAARGTVQIDGQVVLCSGAAVVVTYRDDGQPGGQAHVCPDMALMLLSATALPPAFQASLATLRAMVPGRRDIAIVTHQPPKAAARDPPV